MTEYAMKAIYCRVSYTLLGVQTEKFVFKMSPILILNTNAKLLYYILLKSIKESSLLNMQLGALFPVVCVQVWESFCWFAPLAKQILQPE